jgi:hypothetical protein
MNEEITQAARMLYENIKADIDNASTRLEHVRLTALAQEAANLVIMIDNRSSEGPVTTNE